MTCDVLLVAAQLPTQTIQHATNIIEQNERVFRALGLSKTEFDAQNHLSLELSCRTFCVRNELNELARGVRAWPSAIFDGIEIAARRICETSPNFLRVREVYC